MKRYWDDLVSHKSCILALAHLVQGIVEMAHHMKLVIQNSGLGSMPVGRAHKGLPHIHNGQLNPTALLLAQKLKEKIHTPFRSIFTPKPNRPLPQKITHHNPVAVSLSDRYFGDTYHLRPRQSRPLQLLLHVLLFQRLHRLLV